MHPRTTAVLLATAGLLALTACSSSSSHDKTPPATTAATTTATPAPVSEPPVPTGDQYATEARTAACWKAIRDQYTPGIVQLTGAPTTPPQCAGLSSDEVSAVAEDVLAHQLDG